MEKLRVVFKGYGKAFQAGSGGVVVSAEDVVRALMKGRWSDETRWLVWNGDVAAPRVRTGDGVVFADGRGAVEAVEVHKSWSLKAPAMSVAVK